MKLETVAAGLVVACALGACGSRDGSGTQSSRRSSPGTAAPPVATAKSAAFHAGAAKHPPSRADARTTTAITKLLTAVFEHPEAAQCTSTMTPRYVAQAFTADARRSGTSPSAECRAHQRLRAQLPEAQRRVTVPAVVKVTGDEAHATVRGANGYPVGVLLSRHESHWRLDGFGAAATARGQGTEIAPADSLYAYRVPPGFVTGGTAIGPVVTTGAAFSTSVGLPGGRAGEGVVVAQGTYGSGIHDHAALRAAIPHLDHDVRQVANARAIGPPVIGNIGGRLAVSWDIGRAGFEPPYTDGRTVVVFSSAANVVVVNCRWPENGPNRTVLRDGCSAVLATLSVG